MEITQNTSLQNLHSFGSNEKANYFAKREGEDKYDKKESYRN